MEPEISPPFSEEPATAVYTQRDESKPHSQNMFSKLYPPNYVYAHIFQMVSSFQAFQLHLSEYLSFLPFVLHVPSFSSLPYDRSEASPKASSST